MLDIINQNGMLLLGCGKMGSAMLEGWLDRGVEPSAVWVNDPHPSDYVKALVPHGLNLNAPLPAAPALCVIAVKPQMMGEALPAIAALGTGNTLFVSIAAGTTLGALAKALGPQARIIRAMPNTPSMIQAGATGLFTQSDLTTEQRSLVDQIFQAIGYSCWVDSEELIDAVIAVSGSGPAYFFLVLEAMQKIAQELGLPKQTAQELSLHTALGASRMAMESGISAAELRDQVTSPGGTTQAAIKSFQQHGLEDIFRTAMTSAVARAQEMSKDFSS